MKKPFLAVAAVALLTGCSLIPDYNRPDSPVSTSWPKGEAYGAQPSGGPQWSDLGWKQVFTDPVLQSLIQQALDNNRDLRVAALNIEVARASYGLARANTLPELDANGNETIKRTPKGQSATVPQAPFTSRTTNLTVGVTSFELDLFGRLASLKEQAQENLLATEEGRNVTQIALVAEVANAALTLLADHKLLVLTEETLQSRQKSLDLIQRSFDKGIGSQLDVAQARTTVETARAARAQYLRQVAQDKNALVLLVGAPVDDAKLASLGNLDAVRFMEDMPVALPADVMLRRPDIIQAEHSLKAANANIGAARAAYFPSITLTGAGGLGSNSLSGLFSGGAGAWNFMPAVSLPIFDGGKNDANLDSAKANRDIAVAQYEKAIQTAFREVSDALAAKGTLTSQLSAETALVDATSTSLRLSQARYDRGVDSYLTVLDSQRSLYSAQQEQINVQLSTLSNMVTLYKVLGGGLK